MIDTKDNEDRLVLLVAGIILHMGGKEGLIENSTDWDVVAVTAIASEIIHRIKENT